MESVPFDLQQYLQRLGPHAALKAFAEFAEATKGEPAFGPTGALRYIANLPALKTCLADPGQPPDMSEFHAVREAYPAIFTEVMDTHRLDALVFPQMRDPLPPLHGGEPIHETTVCEINIAGLPGMVVPAGVHDGGAPFCLIFVGRKWSEAELLAFAFDYEQATHYRTAPTLIDAASWTSPSSSSSTWRPSRR